MRASCRCAPCAGGVCAVPPQLGASLPACSTGQAFRERGRPDRSKRTAAERDEPPPPPGGRRGTSPPASPQSWRLPPRGRPPPPPASAVGTVCRHERGQSFPSARARRTPSGARLPTSASRRRRVSGAPAGPARPPPARRPARCTARGAWRAVGGARRGGAPRVVGGAKLRRGAAAPCQGTDGGIARRPPPTAANGWRPSLRGSTVVRARRPGPPRWRGGRCASRPYSPPPLAALLPPRLALPSAPPGPACPVVAKQTCLHRPSSRRPFG